MADDMLESTEMTKRMDTEFSLGQMAANTMESGKTEGTTVLEFGQPQSTHRKKDSGTRANGFAGLLIQTAP